MVRNGFSLVELLVALLLGSLISIAATQLFLVNRQADNLQQGLSSVQDQGRFIFDYLSRDLMQAGHDPDSAVEPFLFDVGSTQRSLDDSPSDTLVMRVNGGIDCVGNPGFNGIKKYHVGGDRNLICVEYIDNVGAWDDVNSESLINNVEAFQVLYGLDYDSLGESGYGQADAYVPASLAVGATQRIVSARFAVLLSSDRVVGFDASLAPAAIQLLDQSIDDADNVNLDDGRMYRVYSSTVALRNLKEDE